MGFRSLSFTKRCITTLIVLSMVYYGLASWMRWESRNNPLTPFFPVLNVLNGGVSSESLLMRRGHYRPATSADYLRYYVNESIALREECALHLHVVSVKPRLILLPRTPQSFYQSTSRDEIATRRVMHRIFQKHCEGGAKPPLVLDMGANDGFYAILASSYGCRVVSFEPQSACVRKLAYALAINDFSPQVDLRNCVVGKSEGSFVMVADNSCSGMQTYGASERSPFERASASIGTAISNIFLFFKYGWSSESAGGAFPCRLVGANKVHPATQKRTGTQAVTSCVAESDRVLLWHIDVEGAEVLALNSGKLLIENSRVENLIIEWSPDMWGNYQVAADQSLIWKQLFQNQHYTCYDLKDWKTGRPLKPVDIDNVDFGASHEFFFTKNSDVLSLDFDDGWTGGLN